MVKRKAYQEFIERHAKPEEMPRKLTPLVHGTLVELLRAGLSREASCATAGICSRSLRDWLDLADEPDAGPRIRKFAEDIRAAEAAPVKDSILRIRQSDDWRAHAWFLERSRPEYRDRKHSEVELTGRDGGPLNVGVIVLPPEQLGAREDDEPIQLTVVEQKRLPEGEEEEGEESTSEPASQEPNE